MKTVYNKYKKERIAELPRAVFEGRIEVVQSESEVRRAVDVLRRADIIGLDTETRPNFTGHHMNSVALLQVSTREICFLFRLNMIGLPDEVVALLCDPNLLKVGLSLQDDFRQLHHLRPFQPAGYVELQDFVKPFGIQDLALQKLYANLLGGRISKSKQLSNWESSVLTSAQKEYAATDAWACILLYDEMMRMRHDGFQVLYEPDEVPEPVVVMPKEMTHVNQPHDAEIKPVEEPVATETAEQKVTKPKPTRKASRKSTKASEADNASASQERPVVVLQSTAESAAAELKKHKSKRRKKAKTVADETAANPSPSTTVKSESPKSELSKSVPTKSASVKTKSAKAVSEKPAPTTPPSPDMPASDKRKRKKSSHRKPKREAPTLVPLDEPKVNPEPVKLKGGLMSRLAKKIVDKLT